MRYAASCDIGTAENGVIPLTQSGKPPFQIKICGLTQPQQAIVAREAGADAIGLNFFEPSIRCVSADLAALISAAARQQTQKQSAPSPKVVGVFVNHSASRILELTTKLKLDGIQLHGDETVEFFAELKKQIAGKFASGTRPFFVRALRTQPEGDQHDVDRDAETRRIAAEIRSWSESGIDTILLDAAAIGEFGGTGKSIDWSLMPELQTFARSPLALAGGLNPDNVAQAIQTAQVAIVDVASGVESPKGVKCPDQVRKFIQRARLAFDSQTQR